MLDRDDIAARLMAALYSREVEVPTVRCVQWALEGADALLAALASKPAAPSTPAPAPAPAPAPVAERPEWVKVTGPSDACRVTVGKAYKVLEWGEKGSPLVKADDGLTWRLAAPGDNPAYYWPSWEPIPPPPAATTGKEECEADWTEAAHKYADEKFGGFASTTERNYFVSGWVEAMREARAPKEV